ncbi:MAG TPA: ParB/RepB/Spo0J family partition protein [Armatimonadota bacterium]|nr:ParB/RepB/Spo0J family partition protein [Armatimonadota bacterium]
MGRKKAGKQSADSAQRTAESSQQPADSSQQSAASYAEIPIGKIVVSGDNPRKHFDEEKLLELAESIRAHGVIEPIVVRPVRLSAGDRFQSDGQEYVVDAPGGAEVPNITYKREKALQPAWETHEVFAEKHSFDLKGGGLYRYHLIVGERRLRAAVIAGLTSVPAIVKECDDRKSSELRLIENLQRQDLDVVEEATGYQALIALGYSQSEIGAKVGRAQPTIANSIRLLKLPEDVKERVSTGEISGSHGRALVPYAEINPAAASVLASAAADHRQLTSKQLEQMDYSVACMLGENLCVQMRTYDAPFVEKTCQGKCDCYRKGDWCLKPECYKAKLAVAEQAHRKRVEALIAKATGEGVEVVDLSKLRSENYETLREGHVPDGCREDCEHRRLGSHQKGGEPFSVCVNMHCYRKLRKATIKAKNAARKQELDQLLSRCIEGLDAHQRFDRLEAVVCWEAIRAANKDVVKAAIARLDLPLDVELLKGFGKLTEKLDALRSLPGTTAMYLAAEILLRGEHKQALPSGEYCAGATPVGMQWYLEIEETSGSAEGAAEEETVEQAAEPASEDGAVFVVCVACGSELRLAEDSEKAEVGDPFGTAYCANEECETPVMVPIGATVQIPGERWTWTEIGWQGVLGLEAEPPIDADGSGEESDVAGD